ncbi:ATP-binding cassette domain-containing protein [bacterium]|nr:ATP-binding cassette domain-containing protein [bacterium]
MNQSPTTPMIEMSKIVKTYENAAGKFTVLKEIDLQICSGEFVSIMGKSGSGKSTLLNMITGIDHPTSGQMVVGGKDIYTGVSESERSRWRGRNLGIVFQFFQLLPTLTLLENVMLSMDFANMYPFESRPQRAYELLKLVGLESFAHMQPAFVSTGQQQLTAIARALACDPPLLVADEPTGNLDSKSTDIIINLFDKLAHSGKTVVLVTHDPSLTSKTTRNILISDGEVINETIVQAFPWLEHPLMLALTKLAQERTFQPGDDILTPQAGPSNIYILQSGQAEQIAARRGRKPAEETLLQPGEFFGEDPRHTQVRATGSQPVQTLSIPAEDFHRIMAQSVFAEEALHKTTPSAKRAK